MKVGDFDKFDKALHACSDGGGFDTAVGDSDIAHEINSVVR